MTSRTCRLAPPPPAGPVRVERFHLARDARRLVPAVGAGGHPGANLVGLARVRRRAAAPCSASRPIRS